jgi:hypothetical protein
VQVRVLQAREVIVGKGRIEQMAVAGHAFAQGARKGGLAPVADAGGRVRRDVGRVDGAEGRGQPAAAGEGRAAGAGVAADAVAQVGDARAGTHQRRVETGAGRHGDGCDRRLPGERDSGQRQQHQQGKQDTQHRVPPDRHRNRLLAPWGATGPA